MGAEGASEELIEALERPDSMLTPRVKQALLRTIREEQRRAAEAGDDAYVVELQKARKLVNKGCWTVRRQNPYLEFVAECIAEERPNRRLTLEETQRLMRTCALRWRQLPDEEKEKRRGKGLAIYDRI